ncbi:MAG: adenosylcobinamide amidohydrolase [Candidatus Methanomethylophilaceae archaeon]|nr:adenosylcobinamide amidohydrolase [Candidatus Methanomethylophilaceae archaeon]
MFTWRDILEEEPVDERRKVAEMCCDIEVFRQCRSLILVPRSEVRVLSGSRHESSFVQGPMAITNNSSIGVRVENCLMDDAPNANDLYTDEMQRRIGLDPDRTIAFGTAAHMDNAAVTNLVSEGGVKVSAAVTGGIRGNGGRAGDPAYYDEAERRYEKPGTIVIMLAIDADVPDGQCSRRCSPPPRARAALSRSSWPRACTAPESPQAPARTR